MKVTDRNTRSEEFEQMLVVAFRKAGLRVKRPVSAVDDAADLVFEKDGTKYLVQLKVSSEGRSDRLIPLLSQAILQARSYSLQSGGANPVAVVAARHIPASVAGQIQEFAKRHAPEVGVGVIDAEGLRLFIGFGLEAFDAKPSRGEGSEVALAPRLPDLFSDLNQWMLKVLIGQRLPEMLIAVPRESIRNASPARYCSRRVHHERFTICGNQLSDRRFLHRRDDLHQIVRLEELLDLWISANREAADEIPARWIIKKGPDQLKSALRDYAAPHPSRSVIRKATAMLSRSVRCRGCIGKRVCSRRASPHLHGEPHTRCPRPAQSCGGSFRSTARRLYQKTGEPRGSISGAGNTRRSSDFRHSAGVVGRVHTSRKRQRTGAGDSAAGPKAILRRAKVNGDQISDPFGRLAAALRTMARSNC